jgi:DNA polymerase-3 subunit epsilon
MTETRPARRLLLERPLAFVDLETTGLNVEDDRIVELAVVKLMPDGERQSRVRRLHPGRPIPPSATAIHGITDDDVRGCPTFAQVARSLLDFLSGCDLGGYNVESYDLRMLAAEFSRCGLALPVAEARVVDPMRIFTRKESRDLTAAVRFYCGRAHAGAHGAEADVNATIDVLVAQLDRYEDLPLDVAGLHEFCHPRDPRWVDATGKLRRVDDGSVGLGFGKYLGRKLDEVVRLDPGYVQWILEGQFPADTKAIVAAAWEEARRR